MLRTFTFMLAWLCGIAAAAQEQPYSLPGQINALSYPEEFNGQIQAWRWINIGAYERAKQYHDRTMYPIRPLSNADFIAFSKLERVPAAPVILKKTAEATVAMFNEAHHIPTNRMYLRELLPQLYAQGFRHLAIEGLETDRITASGKIRVAGDDFQNDPQFVQLLRTTLQLGIEVHGYSYDRKDTLRSRERQHAEQIAAIYQREAVEKLLVFAGYDHINERPDHPNWGKAMAAEFREITGVNPLTIEQATMLAQADRQFDNPYRRAVGLLHTPTLMRTPTGEYWREPNEDQFDLQVFHPRMRYVAGHAAQEFMPDDRLLPLDSILRLPGVAARFHYPTLAKIYLRDDWETLGQKAAPYEVHLLERATDKLRVPSGEALQIVLQSEYGERLSLGAEALNWEATLVLGGLTYGESGWEKQNFYLVDGTIRQQVAKPPTDTISVAGKYLTPGFADGHTHNLDRMWQTFMVDQYLAEGTLYVQNLTSKAKGAKKFQKYLQTRPAPLVRYPNWGFTSTLGHPFMAYEPYAMGLRDMSTWERKKDEIRQSRRDLYNSYAFVDSVEQLNSIWPAFLDTQPDFVKVYYFNEAGIPEQGLGEYGLRLEVAQAIIDSAHAAGLDVYAHIVSRKEFERMLEAGTDGLAHMPGISWHGDSTRYPDYYLPDSILIEAAKRGVILNPTAALAKFQMDSAALDTCTQYQFDLISRYRKLGGKVIVGSDMFSRTGSEAYNYYAKHFPLNEGELLRLLTTETAQVAFPLRAVGALRHGFRADFLVFGQPPLLKPQTVAKPEKVFVAGQLAVGK